MQFEKNATILSKTGDKLGHIDRVVIDPKSKEVSHIVAQKGILFKKEKLIPLDLVDRADKNQVVLNEDVDNLDSLPDFEKTYHIPAEYAGEEADHGMATPLYWYSSIPTRVWWGVHSGYMQYPDWGMPPYVATIEQNIPDGTVPLTEGAKVFSADGDHIGNIEKVYTATSENRAIYLLLSKGLLLKTAKLVPTAWVDHILEDEVHLTMGTSILETLPAFSY